MGNPTGVKGLINELIPLIAVKWTWVALSYLTNSLICASISKFSYDSYSQSHYSTERPWRSTWTIGTSSLKCHKLPWSFSKASYQLKWLWLQNSREFIRPFSLGPKWCNGACYVTLKTSFLFYPVRVTQMQCPISEVVQFLNWSWLVPPVVFYCGPTSVVSELGKNIPLASRVLLLWNNVIAILQCFLLYLWHSMTGMYSTAQPAWNHGLLSHEIGLPDIL